MTTKHTPGPWAIHESSDPLEKYADGYAVRVNAPDSGPVAYAKHYGPLWPEHAPQAFANARLIAAAPDYDAAARLAVEYRDLIRQNYPDLPGLLRALDALAAAIARATGGEGGAA